jgi:hypothetical protein
MAASSNPKSKAHFFLTAVFRNRFLQFLKIVSFERHESYNDGCREMQKDGEPTLLLELLITLLIEISGLVA